MKKSFSVVFVMMVGLFLGACSGGDDDEASANSLPAGPMVEAVTLSAQVSSVREGKLQVQGETNLPSGTKLSVNLGSETVKSISEVTATVTKGAFAVTLPVDNAGLEVGNYQIKVVVSVAASQPKSVQTIIGEQGQHLTGPLIKDISWGGRIAERVFPYTVGE